MERQLSATLVEDLQLESETTNNIVHNQNKVILKQKDYRKYVKKIGKEHLLDFTDEELKRLKECFDQLDDDGSGAIGSDELENPLIGLGFADTREEIDGLVELVDEDGSGQIEFDEFLQILKNTGNDPKTAKINKFFKDVGKGFGSKDLGFT